jgi:hypothetical protein
MKIISSPIDFRDYPYVPVVDEIIGAMDLCEFVHNVENQETIGSCVTNALAAAVEIYLKRAGMPADISRLFAYYVTLAYENRIGQDGVNIRDALKVARILGMPLESIWPYDIAKRSDNPPFAAYFDASGRKLHRFEVVYDEDRTSLIHKIKSAIFEGLPVLMGINIGELFRNIKGDWHTQPYPRVSYPFNPSIGIHAMCIVGFDDNVNKFLVLNSWGEKWGDGGFWGMDYDLVTEMDFEAWAIRGFAEEEIMEQAGIKLEFRDSNTIHARIVPLEPDKGRTVKVWVAAKVGNDWWLKKGHCHPQDVMDNRQDVWEHVGEELKPCDEFTLIEDTFLTIVNRMDLAPFAGAKVYVAYGSKPYDWVIQEICTV